ncbi:MAG: protein-L-isoaspartate O-methyltransferase [Alphaproteobacteria bacterium]|nr:protein-L-isoaspartate O-methyltransferase [Alphaproteobacteria bacterium]
MTDFDVARRHMIEGQLRPNKVTDERVIAAMAEVPREQFVAPQSRSIAYVDEDLKIGDGRCLMEPVVFARMLQAAAIHENDKVLLIGAGSGYGAAVIADLASRVFAVESNHDLARTAKAHLSDLGVANVTVIEGSLAAGHSGHAPYDAIIVEGAVEEVPSAWIEQLADGGRMLLIQRDGRTGRVMLHLRSGAVVGARPLFDAAVPVLPGLARKPAFVF